MTDPRHRAPFAHQSSSLDLRGFAGTPPQPSSSRLNNLLAPPLPGNNIQGGPGYFAPPPPQPPSHFRNAVASASGALAYGMRVVRKTTESRDDGDDWSERLQALTSQGLSLPGAQTVRFVLLCTLWYATSAVSSNTGKVILNNFKFPVTLTIVQFAFVAGLCWVGARRHLNWTARLRTPTKAIVRGTLPMAAFQVGGHIFSSLAISRVPVSTVHTIKALSPLFTVLAYAMLFGVSYSPATYLSLLPLTLGVMLAVSFDISLSNYLGLICAFGSTIVFVSQNIFFKKIMPTNSSSSSGSADSPRLDKINLLYFSSGLAFLLMIPIWIYSDFLPLVSLWVGNVPFPGATGTVSSAKIFLYFVINGTVHFAQCILAFAILSSTSPVTYSIASLVKRIAVICLAIVWFNQPVHGIQAVGILLTGVGLWMYNNAKRDVEKGEKRARQVEALRDGMLPSNLGDARVLEGNGFSTPHGNGPAHTNGHAGVYDYSASIPTHPPRAQEKMHASPRPMYDGFEPPAVGKASARSPTYSRVKAPYPSPPASTASSPPLPALGDETLAPPALMAS